MTLVLVAMAGVLGPLAVSRQRRWQKVAGIAATVALLIAGAAVSTWPVSQASRVAVSGSVRCISGAAVVGIYVRTSDRADEGWASLQPNLLDPSEASFAHTLPDGKPYLLRIGCGEQLSGGGHRT
jgi:hypothetical protein